MYQKAEHEYRRREIAQGTKHHVSKGKSDAELQSKSTRLTRGMNGANHVCYNKGGMKPTMQDRHSTQWHDTMGSNGRPSRA